MTLSINISASEITGQHGQLIDAHFVFGNRYEKCSLPLNYWRLCDYVSQWISTLSQVADSSVPGAMITSINDPSIAVNIVAWILYPLSDGSVKIQQHLLDPDRFVRNRKMVHHFKIRPREVVSEDGEAISEWTVSITDLLAARNELLHLHENCGNE
jgi:hypothetical protein